MKLRIASGLATLSISLAAQASCGAAFCAVNTSWDAQGAWTERGSRLDLRYEVLRQDEPRSGSEKVAVGAIRRHHDEVATLNRNLIVGVDHAFDAHWGLSASLPVVHRAHEHIHNHRGARIEETWRFTEAGDLRLLGRYQLDPRQRGEAELEIVGVNFGVKLPTGDFNVRNAAGALAERSLQPGAGTTDALLGAYYVRLHLSRPLARAAVAARLLGARQLPLPARPVRLPVRQVHPRHQPAADGGARSARLGPAPVRVLNHRSLLHAP